ncbi:hypothetical protein HMPREF9420_2047 [Segatella salivae DSM 15606]|uniref:Uncharacterized protein n=1 Tax=Segatella salivae DSM 15606 TaxID=888832 RepID=E6MRC9_9BACT|nr:hypothetical protein HMPREF9420_2047 [Segatella salivae DSM 15606]
MSSSLESVQCRLKGDFLIRFILSTFMIHDVSWVVGTDFMK